MIKPSNQTVFVARDHEIGDPYYDTDITLRDLFAAFCAAGELAGQGAEFIDYTDDSGRKIAERSYQRADALLAHRAEEPSDG